MQELAASGRLPACVWNIAGFQDPRCCIAIQLLAQQQCTGLFKVDMRLICIPELSKWAQPRHGGDFVLHNTTPSVGYPKYPQSTTQVSRQHISPSLGFTRSGLSIYGGFLACHTVQAGGLQ